MSRTEITLWVFWFAFPVTGTHTRRASVWTCCEMASISPSLSSSLWWRSGTPWGRPRGSGPSCGCRDLWRSSLISWTTSTTTWPGLRWPKGKVSGRILGGSAALSRTAGAWGKLPDCSVCEFATLRQPSAVQLSQLSIFVEERMRNAGSQGCPRHGGILVTSF